MSRPRYIVASVTGYDGAEGSHTERPRTDFMVEDTLYCYRVVATFTSRGKDDPGYHARRKAESLAAQLNAGDEAWRDALARDSEHAA